ncbi:hypothetical protein P4B35_01310 [Pontiellaceae bacterium B12227]|nr:hypothetical protein [Pontiellaceae bacterium B12227]
MRTINTSRGLGRWLLFVFVVPGCINVFAESFTIFTPGGPVVIDVGHLNPAGGTVSPEAPTATEFRPPSIFSAPLPVGSGARALGVGGAFTAVADDATAASWNPAGLMQLEKPELSFMLRASQEIQKHHSTDSGYQAGEESFEVFRLNYLSAVYPFRVFDQNVVLAFNYQEAYDFTYRFSAGISDSSQQSLRNSATDSAAEMVTNTYVTAADPSLPNGTITMDVISRLTTYRTTTVDQLLTVDSLTGMQFEQSGIIDALSPALACEISPKFSVGGALNFYANDMLGGGSPIESRTSASYAGTSVSSASILEELVTDGIYDYSGVIEVPAGGIYPIGLTIPFTGSGAYDPFTNATPDQVDQSLPYAGSYQEYNRIDGLYGVNATLGATYTVSRFLSVAAMVDLPWQARGEQEKTVQNSITTFDASGTNVVDVTTTMTNETRDIKIDFPLYWSLGAVLRWNNRLRTSVDLGETLWSDYAYEVNGKKINPIDGSDYGENRIDDCWTLRTGTEYLIVLKKSVIPLRVGAAWEQRPAIGTPDDFWTLSCGTGIAVGKTILDIAYAYTWANDVLESLVPDQQGLTTDVSKHAVYFSLIRHF